MAVFTLCLRFVDFCHNPRAFRALTATFIEQARYLEEKKNYHPGDGHRMLVV